MTPALKAEIMKHVKFYGTGKSHDCSAVTKVTITMEIITMVTDQQVSFIFIVQNPPLSGTWNPSSLCSSPCTISVCTPLSPVYPVHIPSITSLIRYSLGLKMDQPSLYKLSLGQQFFACSFALICCDFAVILFVFSFLYLFALRVQGAPEGVLERCTHVRVGTEKVPMTNLIKEEIMGFVRVYGTGQSFKVTISSMKNLDWIPLALSLYKVPKIYCI